MFGMMSKEAAAQEILAFTATATPQARLDVQEALTFMNARAVCKMIRRAKVRAATGNY